MIYIIESPLNYISFVIYSNKVFNKKKYGTVAEWSNAPDSRSGSFGSAGSNPAGTKWSHSSDGQSAVLIQRMSWVRARDGDEKKILLIFFPRLRLSALIIYISIQWIPCTNLPFVPFGVRFKHLKQTFASDFYPMSSFLHPQTYIPCLLWFL